MALDSFLEAPDQVYRRVVPRGLEPRTLRLLAVRSDQLSYETSVYIPWKSCKPRMPGTHFRSIWVTLETLGGPGNLAHLGNLGSLGNLESRYIRNLGKPWKPWKPRAVWKHWKPQKHKKPEEPFWETAKLLGTLKSLDTLYWWLQGFHLWVEPSYLGFLKEELPPIRISWNIRAYGTNFIENSRPPMQSSFISKEFLIRNSCLTRWLKDLLYNWRRG